MTTEGREDDYKRGLDAGASAYLKKPFTPDALVELMQGLLANPIRAGATYVSQADAPAPKPETPAHRVRNR